MKMDPTAPVDGPGFQASCFLAASSFVGPDDQRIAGMLGLPLDRAAFWTANLRRGGIWREGVVCCESWFDEERGFVVFILAMLVAEGLLERKLNEVGEALYRCKAGPRWWQNN